MPQLTPDFKAELRTKANENLKRHFQRLEDEFQNQAVDPPSQELLESFAEHLRSSNRILALVGAGLSAASGIPTYRGPGGFWRTYSDQQLASYGAFKHDPCLVWQFYNYRRHQALAAQPNKAHHTLAALAKRKPDLLVISQNVDGLCKRAGHPPDQIIDLHGSLFRVKCTGAECDFEGEDLNDPITPGLAMPLDSDFASDEEPSREIARKDLPHCPKCKENILRPAVVWFGESISEVKADTVEKWLASSATDSSTDAKVDLLLVIGTSAIVYPAAGFIEKARKRGARVAFFNMEVKTAGVARPEPGDWSFVGDATELLPIACKPLLGL